MWRPLHEINAVEGLNQIFHFQSAWQNYKLNIICVQHLIGRGKKDQMLLMVTLSTGVLNDGKGTTQWRPWFWAEVFILFTPVFYDL